jgi:hypothetical protein
MKLGHAVDRLGLNGRSLRSAFVSEGVDGAIGRLGEPPSAAEIDDADAASEGLGDPLARLLVGRGEKEDLNAAIGQELPGERLLCQLGSSVVVGKLGMDLDKRHTAAGRVLVVDTSGKDRWRALEAWVVEQEPGEFATGVACDTDDRGLDGVVMTRARSLAGFDSACMANVGADDEHGVVAGDGADDLGPSGVVERGGDRLGSAHDGADDHLIHGLANAQAEALDHLLDGGWAVVFHSCGVSIGAVAVRKRVAAGAFGEAQLVDVARKRGLGNGKAATAQLAPEFVLIGDQGAPEQIANRIVALQFHEHFRFDRPGSGANALLGQFAGLRANQEGAARRIATAPE